MNVRPILQSVSRTASPFATKIRLIYAVLFLSYLGVGSTSFAVHVAVQDPCSAQSWLNTDFSATLGSSVGLVSVATFEKYELEFFGNESGIHSIKDTPTGDVALEILSSTEMRAYGWCYHLNGTDPGVLTDAAKIQSQDDRIYWFFGFAHYLKGEWVAMCVPTHLLLPEFICGTEAALPVNAPGEPS